MEAVSEGLAYRQELLRFLAGAYGLPAGELRPAPRGFFGETWYVSAGGGRYFCKIDYWDYHKGMYERSFPVMQRLLESGLTFLPPLVRGKGGELCFPFRGGVLGLFGLAEGEQREDYPLGELFSRLGRVYQVDAGGLALPREDFAASSLAEFRALAAGLGQGGGFCREAAAVLQRRAPLLQEKAARLLAFARQCRAEPCPLVITHGDAGGNCLVGPGSFTIVDWDSPMLAPPERDAWFFMHRPAQVRQVEEALAEAGFPYRLSFPRFAYYCYFSLFYYLCEHLKALACAPEAARAGRLQKLSDFFSGWIFTQMETADALPYHST